MRCPAPGSLIIRVHSCEMHGRPLCCASGPWLLPTPRRTRRAEGPRQYKASGLRRRTTTCEAWQMPCPVPSVIALTLDVSRPGSPLGTTSEPWHLLETPQVSVGASLPPSLHQGTVSPACPRPSRGLPHALLVLQLPLNGCSARTLLPPLFPSYPARFLSILPLACSTCLTAAALTLWSRLTPGSLANVPIASAR